MLRQVIVGVFISLFSLIFVFKDVDIIHLWYLIIAINPFYMIIVIFLMAIFFLLRSLRWRLLLTPLLKNCPVGKLVSANLIGFMINDILPIRMGELARAYTLYRLCQIPIISILATVIMERIFDGVVLIIFFFITLYFADFVFEKDFFNIIFLRTLSYIFLLACTGVFLGILLIKIWPQNFINFINKLTKRVSFRVGELIKSTVYNFIHGLSILDNFRSLFFIFIQSIFLWVPIVLMYIIFLPALRMPLNLFMGSMAFCGSFLAAIIPAAPGYIGTFQLGVSWGLIMAGAEVEQAVAYSLVSWIMQFLPIVIVGFIEMWRNKIKIDIRLSKFSF